VHQVKPNRAFAIVFPVGRTSEMLRGEIPAHPDPEIRPTPKVEFLHWEAPGLDQLRRQVDRRRRRVPRGA